MNKNIEKEFNDVLTDVVTPEDEASSELAREIEEGDYLLNPIKEYAKKHSYCKAVAQTEIRIASLMNDAGIIGAALACEQ